MERKKFGSNDGAEQFVRRVYEQGKITIPKELRDLLGIKDGSYVRFEIKEIIHTKEPPANSKKGGGEDK